MSYSEGAPHVLVITQDGEPDYEVEHLPECESEAGWAGSLGKHYFCPLGQYLTYQGLEGLEWHDDIEPVGDVPTYGAEWRNLPAGRYHLRTWTEYHAYCNERDGGLIVEPLPVTPDSPTEG